MNVGIADLEAGTDHRVPVFRGLSIPETAAALDISPATVKREWQAASAWLYAELARSR